MQPGDQSPAGPRLRRPHAGDLAAIGDGVADIDRLEPFELADAGRGPERRYRLAARTRGIVFAAAQLDQEPHPDAGCVPARGAEPAEMRALGRSLVEMERLRIVARREALDVFGAEGV